MSTYEWVRPCTVANVGTVRRGVVTVGLVEEELDAEGNVVGTQAITSLTMSSLDAPRAGDEVELVLRTRGER